MENASKALTMAAGVLISMLVIGLLVFFYNNMGQWKQTEQKVDVEKQATEFNKQYDVYYREIYGSELLSIANKVDDYNKRESNEKGYTKIELVVIITKSIGGSNDSEYFKINKSGYSAEEIIEQVENLNNEINNIANKKINGLTIKQISSMRSAELEQRGLKYSDYANLKNKYVKLNNLLTTIKATTFKNKEFEYDKNTGRVTKMIYQY